MSTSNSVLNNLSTDWDAIVIGAGPAGAVSALLLARKGLRVLLVDKAQFPRPKVCGSCLSAKTLEYLRMAGLGDLPTALNAPEISAIQLCTTSGAGNIRLPLPLGLALSREALDSGIVRRAQEAGALFLPSASATVGQYDGSIRTVNIRLSDSTEGAQSSSATTKTSSSDLCFSARCVVVADGINGRALTDLQGGERQNFTPLVTEGSRIGAGTIVAGENDTNNDYKSGTIYMAVRRGGYVGLVRLEDNSLDLAAAFDPAFTRRCGSPQAAAREILEGAGLPYLPAFDQGHWLGTAPFTRRRKTLAAERLFVVGDAAGYGEPFTGEGIGWAIYSALLAVPLVCASINKWDNQLALAWQKDHRRLISDKQRTSRRLGTILRNEKMTGLVIGGILKHAPALARPLVERISR